MLAALAVGYSLALIVHEAGHAAMILAVGFELRLVRIGAGPLLLRLRLGKTWLVLRAVPVIAYVVMLPPPPGRRGSQIAVTAAGALANALCCLALGAAALAHPTWFDTVLLLLLAQVCVIAGVLVPVTGRFGSTRLPSDGLRIWHLLTQPGYSTLPALHAVLMQDVLPPGAITPPTSPASAEIAYQVLRPDRLGDPWAARNAALAIRGILQDDPLPSLERAFVLTFLTLSELLYRNIGASDVELDAWSVEAAGLTYAPLPGIVRAGVLIELGDFAAAQLSLQGSLTQPLCGFQPVLAQAFLARALAGQGQPTAAARALALARAAVPKLQWRVMQPILARIEAGMKLPSGAAATPGWRQRSLAARGRG